MEQLPLRVPAHKNQRPVTFPLARQLHGRSVQFEKLKCWDNLILQCCCGSKLLTFHKFWFDKQLKKRWIEQSRGISGHILR